MEKPFEKTRAISEGLKKSHRLIIAVFIIGFALMCYGCSAGCATIMYHVHYKPMIEKDQVERSIRIEQKLDELIRK